MIHASGKPERIRSLHKNIRQRRTRQEGDHRVGIFIEQVGFNHGLEQIGSEFPCRSLAYGFQLGMPCSLVRNEPIIILKVQMRIAGKIMLFKYFIA